METNYPAVRLSGPRRSKGALGVRCGEIIHVFPASWSREECEREVATWGYFKERGMPRPQWFTVFAAPVTLNKE